MTFVVDASVAISWIFEDERTPETDRWLEQLTVGRGVVPGHWALEVANVVVRAARSNRIPAREIQDLFDDLGALRLQVDEGTAGAAFHRIADLAAQYELTTYDAAYLELAERADLPLATRVRALARAARAAGLRLLD
jgi:predicted nucleic acid-binding protein